MHYTIEDLVAIQNEIYYYSTTEFEEMRDKIILKKASWYESQAITNGDLTTEEGRWKILFSLGMAKELRLFANMRTELEIREKIARKYIDQQTLTKQVVPGRRSINLPL